MQVRGSSTILPDQAFSSNLVNVSIPAPSDANRSGAFLNSVDIRRIFKDNVFSSKRAEKGDDMSEVESYTNESVVIRYARDHNKSVAEARGIFAQLKDFLKCASQSPTPVEPPSG